MTNTTKNAFVNKVLEKMTESATGEVVATRNYRKAVAAIKGQISALESSVVEAEEAVAAAEESLENAKYPTTPINNTHQYLRSLLNYNESLIASKQTLENVHESLRFYNSLLKEFTSAETQE